MGKGKITTVYHRQFAVFRGMRLPALSIFFALGAVLGHIVAQLLGGDHELASQLQGYAAVYSGNAIGGAVVSVLINYFRYPLLMLFLGYCSFAAAAIPLVLSMQGFSFAFAAASLGASLGWPGITLALASFGLRSFLTVLCTLWVALWALDRSFGGDSKHYSGRTVIPLCFLLLALGCILELTLVPRLFSLALLMLK